MENFKLHYMKESAIYPGEYILLPELEVFLLDTKPAAPANMAIPPVNMTETEDCFNIEISLPGVKREDIFIHMHNNTLLLFVLKEKITKEKNEKSRMHEFDSNALKRHIPLPSNVDPGFMSAEYKQGILQIYIPKTTQQSTDKDIQVIVY